MSIEVNHISKSYGKQKALDDISFSIGSGEIVGLLGPNGAGKSTLMKIMTGYIEADSGRVKLLDRDISADPVSIKKDIGYLPENNPLYPEMYVREYLEFSGKLYGADRGRKEKVEEIIELTGLSPEKHKKIQELSKGYRQRVGLAQALLHDPSVLILDEPTTGLDPNQIRDIRELISSAGKKKTLILSTHIMQEVEAVCDRVIIINKGKLVLDESLDVLKEENKKLEEIFSELTGK